jgi:hypothetical protein
MPTTKSYQVYKWGELSDESKEKALERYRYFNVEDDFWYDYDGKTGFTSAEISKYHLDPEHSGDLLIYDNMYFDLDYNHRYIWFVNAEFAHDETARKFLGVPKALWNQVYWRIENRRYGRGEQTTCLKYEPQDSDKEFTPKQIIVLDRAVERFADKMHDALQDLEKNYEYQLSDEAIIESFEANDYDFTEDGRID